MNAPVVSRDPCFQFSAPVTYKLQNCELGHDSRRVCTHRRHNSTGQDKFSTCSASKFSSAVVGSRHELVANSIHTADVDATPTQLNSTVESRRRRRCVLGITVHNLDDKCADDIMFPAVCHMKCFSVNKIQFRGLNKESAKYLPHTHTNARIGNKGINTNGPLLTVMRCHCKPLQSRRLLCGPP